jgi:hypothetical protein
MIKEYLTYFLILSFLFGCSASTIPKPKPVGITGAVKASDTIKHGSWCEAWSKAGEYCLAHCEDHEKAVCENTENLEPYCRCFPK